MNFLNNIVTEKKKINDDFLPDISFIKVYNKIIKMFCDYEGEIKTIENKYGEIIIKYLSNLRQKDLNRIYYKNNIYEFSRINKIKNKLYIILNKVESFKDPNKVPESIQEDINDLWSYYKEFVFYNYFAFGRIDRLKKDKRKTVVVVDTDSNMLNLDPWVKFLLNNLILPSNQLSQKNPEELRFICVNIMCYFLTNMVTDVLMKYTKIANIPKDYRSKINMKNEFLFTRLILATTKKRYASSVRLREGKEIYPEKIDIKGKLLPIILVIK